MKSRPKGTWQLFSIGGTSVGIHWSFLLLIVYIFVSQLLKGTPFDRVVLFSLLVLALFGTVLLHELGHVFAAKRFGCRTRDIILLPIGGVARMDKLPEKPSQEISVAAAGPAVNFLLAAITYLFFLDKKDLDFSQLLTSVDAGNWMLHFFFANIYLALFNLLPAFPMDGGRILRGLLSLRFGRIKATWWSARIGQVVALIMFITGLMGSPLLCFIAVFVFLGAQLEAQSTDQQRLLKGVKVSQVMMDRLETIPAGSILRTVSEQLLSSDAVKFIVLQDGQPAGHLDRQDLLDAIGRYGQDVFVDAIMNRDFKTVSRDADVEQLFQWLQESEHPMVLVKDSANRTVGFVDLDNILEFILLRQAEERHQHHWKNSDQNTVHQTA